MKRTFTFIYFILAVVCMVNAQTTWLGTIDNNWSDDGNWSALAPGSSDDAIIAVSSNNPVISGTDAVQCNKLTIDAGATLTIQDDAEIEIFDVVVNSGTILIKNQGSFYADVNVTNNDNITVQDNGIFAQNTGSVYSGSGTFSLSRTGTGDPLKLNLWSSPVTAQNVSALTSGGPAYDFNPANSTTDPLDDESDPGWFAASGNMVAGQGYAAAGAGAVTFSGAPNNGNLSVSVQYNDPSNATGIPYNLLGNPYPSPLDISDFLNTAGNPTDLATFAVYFWDSEKTGTFQISDYATVNDLGTVSSGSGPGTYSTPYNTIKTGQGFFVEIAPGNNGTMNFNNSMRTYGSSTDNSQFYKQANNQRLWLGVSDTDSTVYNETLIAFSDSATNGFDKKYDARKLKGNLKLSLYSLLNSGQYAIQGLSRLSENETEVPVGVTLNTANNITFALRWEEQLDDFEIHLIDYLTGAVTDLRAGNYSLQIDSGAYDARFVVRFTPKNSSTGIDALPDKGITVAYANSTVEIHNHFYQTKAIKNVKVYELNGRVAAQWNQLNETGERLSFPFKPVSSGYYFVEVVAKGTSMKEKIFVLH